MTLPQIISTPTWMRPTNHPFIYGSTDLDSIKNNTPGIIRRIHCRRVYTDRPKRQSAVCCSSRSRFAVQGQTGRPPAPVRVEFAAVLNSDSTPRLVDRRRRTSPCRRDPEPCAAVWTSDRDRIATRRRTGAVSVRCSGLPRRHDAVAAPCDDRSPFRDRPCTCWRTPAARDWGTQDLSLPSRWFSRTCLAR